MYIQLYMYNIMVKTYSVDLHYFAYITLKYYKYSSWCLSVVGNSTCCFADTEL